MAKKVLIIGATGSLGRVVAPYLLEYSDDELTLFSRRANSLPPDAVRRNVSVDGHGDISPCDTHETLRSHVHDSKVNIR